ncbi:MAG: hypothetical protein ACLFSC_12930, partial [Wenzhouxiangella sp.]
RSAVAGGGTSGTIRSATSPRSAVAGGGTSGTARSATTPDLPPEAVGRPAPPDQPPPSRIMAGDRTNNPTQ